MPPTVHCLLCVSWYKQPNRTSLVKLHKLLAWSLCFAAKSSLMLLKSSLISTINSPLLTDSRCEQQRARALFCHVPCCMCRATPAWVDKAGKTSCVLLCLLTVSSFAARPRPLLRSWNGAGSLSKQFAVGNHTSRTCSPTVKPQAVSLLSGTLQQHLVALTVS